MNPFRKLTPEERERKAVWDATEFIRKPRTKGAILRRLGAVEEHLNDLESRYSALENNLMLHRGTPSAHTPYRPDWPEGHEDHER